VIQALPLHPITDEGRGRRSWHPGVAGRKGRTCVCAPLGGSAFASGASSALVGSSARHISAWLRAVGDAAGCRRSARACLTERTVRDAATGALQQYRAAAQAVVLMLVNMWR
jgi:hypothetical protein